ncbi:hypothetical protein CMUST_12235 [Corynebacterium mustelae]|uniref:Uncharacterized protein n=1 Tax=Corynebacterium mustelae TaxID=571915 RepID=A0A0G3H028_9CORY|nr:hypothetical protein CMUST_12235 [Corynebacterium mustelae]
MPICRDGFPLFWITVAVLRSAAVLSTIAYFCNKLLCRAVWYVATLNMLSGVGYLHQQFTYSAKGYGKENEHPS